MEINIGSVDNSNIHLKASKNPSLLNNESDINNEWIKKSDDLGREFYVNTRTGMVQNAFHKPSKFIINPRLDFIPKGMSPVLEGHAAVDKVLSQKAKMTLEKYEKELIMFKWKNCIDNNDSGQFFTNLEKERLKMFRSKSCVPKLSHARMNFKNTWKFDKDILRNVSVIGQLDKKFILAKLENNFLVAFDQHAVDERIRLEYFRNIYTGKSMPVSTITVPVNKEEIPLLESNPALLKALDLKFELVKDSIKIYKVPLCLYEIFHPPAFTENLTVAINKLMKDVIELIKTSKTPIEKTEISRFFRNVLNLKACRGAIKFGDQLSLTKCKSLINQLASCKNPFRCAHGRPTIQPLLNDSELTPNKKISKPKLNKIFMYNC